MTQPETINLDPIAVVEEMESHVQFLTGRTKILAHFNRAYRAENQQLKEQVLELNNKLSELKQENARLAPPAETVKAEVING